MIIDDDQDMCLLLKRFLTRHGYEVLEAHSGKKALDLLDTVEPNLVMCDFRLDDMDGKQLLVKIKERYQHVPVIIITGYSEIKTAVEVMKLGAYDYITKPLFPDEILLTIRKALDTSEKQTESPKTEETSVQEPSPIKNEGPLLRNRENIFQEIAKYSRQF